MTDGTAETWSLINSAYGIEFLDRRTTSDGSIAQANARQWPRFHAACDAIRARGVRVWVIAFTSDLSQDLLQCASPNSAFTLAFEPIAPGAYARCEQRLEQAFDAYSHGHVSLDSYEEMVRAEADRTKQLRAAFEAKQRAANGPTEALDALRAEFDAIDTAVQWCLDWAEGLRRRSGAEKSGKGMVAEEGLEPPTRGL